MSWDQNCGITDTKKLSKCNNENSSCPEETWEDTVGQGRKGMPTLCQDLN